MLTTETRHVLFGYRWRKAKGVRRSNVGRCVDVSGYCDASQPGPISLEAAAETFNITILGCLSVSLLRSISISNNSHPTHGVYVGEMPINNTLSESSHDELILHVSGNVCEEIVQAKVLHNA